MRSKDVKCNKQYLLDGKNQVIVIQRIRGEETTKAIMQSGILFDGYERMKKKYLLNNGETVYAQRLSEIKTE